MSVLPLAQSQDKALSHSPIGVNHITKPVAGAMKFISMPMEGTAKDLRGLFRQEIGKERTATRYAEGILAVRNSSQRDQEEITRAFSTRKIRFHREKKGKGKPMQEC